MLLGFKSEMYYCLYLCMNVCVKIKKYHMEFYEKNRIIFTLKLFALALQGIILQKYAVIYTII